MARNLVGVESRITLRQQDWHGRKTIHDVGQDDDLHIDEQEEQERSFDVVRLKYINLFGVKSIIFTKPDSITS